MTHPFQHILITRMNVEWNISRPVEERNNLDFLSYRFNIFEKTCFPSVNAQSNKNFVWLLLLDSKLPDEFRKRVEQYTSTPQLIPVYIENKDTFLDQLKQAINTHLSASTTHLMTTNLDSDDAISKDFVATIQEQFKGQDFEFINFPFGFMYRFVDEKLYLRDWLTAPCHTLIEQRDNFETASNYKHDTITKYKTRQIPTKPMWLMTVHGKNVRTKFDVNAAWQPTQRLTHDFDIRFDLPHTSYLKTLNEIFAAVITVITSQRDWDSPSVKFKKVANILSPAIMRSLRQAQMVIQKLAHSFQKSSLKNTVVE
ncbi:MAG: glycosyltransferase [Oculatellaceae cyanobacterium bins.114]|nr:glycosyltransferase [Oculatellaceae cyanobacterium bins.114]